MWDTGQSGGAPDSHCSLSGAPPSACSGSARAVGTVHCSLFTFVVDRWRCSLTPHGTPDSPVNYSGGQFQKPKGGKFGVILPGAPDTVRCARSGLPFGCHLLFLFEPFLGLFIGLC
jgi:hypothetical protein